MKLGFFIKIYVVIALVLAAVVSPLAISFLPLIFLIWFLIEWRWPVSAMVDLLTQYFIYFALPYIYSFSIPFYLAPLVSLPSLWLILQGMEKSSLKISFRPSDRKRLPTRLSLGMLSIAAAVLLLSVILARLDLVLAASIMLAVFMALGIFVYRKFPVKPIEEEPVPMRILAGKEESTQVKLNIRSRFGGLLCAYSDQDWIKVKAARLSLKGQLAILSLSIIPRLSTPSTARVKGAAIDRWGLFQTSFIIEAVKLTVIPRARYSSWLAQKYLAGGNAGTLPLLSDVTAIKAQVGLRQGLEYYGDRLYQPGDNLKNINWKHTLKYHELVVKEFSTPQGQPAILLINLVAGDADEADKLAYNIIASVLTLAHENIPATLAVYNHQKVALTTPILPSLQLMRQALQIIHEIVVIPSPVRYLHPPDVFRLRSNAEKLSHSQAQSALTLAELLRLEYISLGQSVKDNPSSLALSTAVIKAGSRVNIVFLSNLNHDAEAVAYNSYIMANRGFSIIHI
jgi:hypothetical protein